MSESSRIASSIRFLLAWNEAESASLIFGFSSTHSGAVSDVLMISCNDDFSLPQPICSFCLFSIGLIYVRY
jgi:hypothetical protein